jgi:hypothetical protein
LFFLGYGGGKMARLCPWNMNLVHSHKPTRWWMGEKWKWQLLHIHFLQVRESYVR